MEQSLQQNISDRANAENSTTGSKAGNPPRPPQKRKMTNQKVPQKKNSDHGSEAWHHFTRIEGSEPVKATCNYYKNEIAASGRNGTSGIWNHLDRCKLYPFRREKKLKIYN